MDKSSSDVQRQGTLKKRIVRYIRNALIGSVVLLIVLIGIGVAYTWFMGRDRDTSPVVVEEAQPEAVSTIKPPQPASNTPVSASVQSLTSPVVPGDNALITVRTKPNATCSIVVEYNKVPSNDSGLVSKVADDFGIVSWVWTVEPSTPLGKWPATVTCVLEERSAVVVGDLLVGDALAE